MTNKEEYIRLCAENDDIPVFMQPWWLDAVCAGKEWDVLLSREDSSNPENTKILGAMPYLLRKKWGMRYIVMPQQTQLGGIVVFDDRQQGDLMLGDTRIATAVCQDIKQQLDAMGLCYYYQQYIPGNSCPGIMQGLGMKVKERVTYRVNDLRDMNKVVDSFSKNKKRQLQKAMALKVERGLNVETFYTFHKNCMEERKREIAYTREFLLVLQRKAARAKQCEIISIRTLDDELCAAAFLVWDKQYLYYLIPCYSERFKDSGAGALLALEAMKVAREQHVKFDFEGSMNSGIANHYKQLGSTAETYYSVEKLYKWWFWFALLWNKIRNLKYGI
ncbi:MAG: GNAT family N-acetyltransferase [Paludibacteraceae bacterium]|nr:GNAT family N-acetyltransferase [Paludibacteraceae bacterium]